MVERKKKELPAPISGLPAPNINDVDRFRDYYSRMPHFNSNTDVRDHLKHLMFGVMHGLVDTKVANCQVYITSHVLIALDRMRQFENLGLAGDIDDFADEDGNLNLTEDQLVDVLQEPKQEVQIQLIERFTKENKKNMDLVKLSEEHSEEAIEASVKEVKKEYDFLEDVEF